MSFFVEFINSFTLVDLVLVLLRGMVNHADLIILIDEVAVNKLSVGPLH